MYYFNSILFKNLSSVLGMTQYELSMKVFGNNHRYRQKIDNQSLILVSDMVEICNSLHISLSHFISLDPNMSYRDKAIEYIMNEKIFKPILFNSQSLRKMYGKDGLAGPITKDELAKGIGVSSPSIYLWINKGLCTIKMSQLIGMCNTFGVNMGEFVKDENIPLPLNDVVVQTGSKASTKQFEELVELREIVSENQREIAKLKQQKKSLEFSFKGYQVAEEAQAYASGKSPIREWAFHKGLLDNLPNLLHTSKDDLLKGLGMTNPSVSYNDGDITVQLLIDLCNKYQLSSKHFFFRQTDSSGAIRELSFYQSENFKPIQFHPEYIADIFGRDSLTGMSLNEVLAILGYSEMKIRGWRNVEKSSLRVNDLVELCNALSVTPSCFITDTNRTAAMYSSTQTEFFLEENRMLRQEAIRLKESLKRVKKKNSDEK